MAALFVPYAISVAALYQFGFWGPLGINPLDYMGLSDIATRAALPLIGLAVFGLVGAGISHFLTFKRYPPGGGADSNIARAVRSIWNVALALDLLLIACAALFLPDLARWYVIAVLVIPFAVALTHVPYVINLIPNVVLRNFLLVQFAIFPLIAFAQGRLQVHFIENDSSRPIVDMASSQVDVIYDHVSPLVYLGRLGEHVVLFETRNGNVHLFELKEGQSLVLAPRRK